MFGRIVNFVHTIGLLHAIAVLVLLVASTTVLINRGGSIATLIAGSAASVGTDTVLYITPHGTSTLNIGDTEDIDIRINTKAPVNTVGATIKFPQDAIDVVGISKADSFLDLWTEETTIKESDGEVHFSGGTTQKGGLSGIGTIVTLTVKAKKAGAANLYFKDSQVYAADGKGSSLQSDNRDLTFTIPLSTSSAPAAGSSASKMSTETLPPLPIDFNNDGRVSVVDFSIMAIQVLAPYNAKFDLDRDGAVTISDLSIFFARMRQP